MCRRRPPWRMPHGHGAAVAGRGPSRAARARHRPRHDPHSGRAIVPQHIQIQNCTGPSRIGPGQLAANFRLRTSLPTRFRPRAASARNRSIPLTIRGRVARTYDEMERSFGGFLVRPRRE